MALRLVAAAFAALGVVPAAASIHNLATGRKADASPVGIAYLAGDGVRDVWARDVEGGYRA